MRELGSVFFDVEDIGVDICHLFDQEGAKGMGDLDAPDDKGPSHDFSRILLGHCDNL